MKTQIDQLKREVYPAKLMVVTKGRTQEEIHKAVQAGAEYLNGLYDFFNAFAH